MHQSLCDFLPVFPLLEERSGPPKNPTLTFRQPSPLRDCSHLAAAPLLEAVLFGLLAHCLLVMEQSGAAWQGLDSLSTPSHPGLGWHLWPGYPPDPALSPSPPSSSQTSPTHLTLLRATPSPLWTETALPWKPRCPVSPLSSQPWPECLPQQTRGACQAALCHPLPGLLGAFDALPRLFMRRRPSSAVAETQGGTSDPCHNVRSCAPTNRQH